MLCPWHAGITTVVLRYYYVLMLLIINFNIILRLNNPDVFMFLSVSLVSYDFGAEVVALFVLSFYLHP